MQKDIRVKSGFSLRISFCMGFAIVSGGFRFDQGGRRREEMAWIVLISRDSLDMEASLVLQQSRKVLNSWVRNIVGVAKGNWNH